MCSTVQEQITTCGQNAIVKIGERTNIRPQKWKSKFWYNYAPLQSGSYHQFFLPILNTKRCKIAFN